MGGSSSKSTQITEYLNSTTTNVLNTVSARASGTISNTQDITISGNTGNITGINMVQLSKIDLHVLQDATINADLQTSLINKISNTVKQHATDFPSITSNTSVSEIRNKITNVVSTNFSVESLATLQLEIDNTQKVDISDNAGNIDDINITQKANAIGSLINNLSSDIKSTLGVSNDTTNTSDQSTTFFGADFVKSIGDAIGSIFSNPYIVIGLVIVVLVGGYYVLNKGKMAQQMQQMQQMPPPSPPTPNYPSPNYPPRSGY